jgi:thymidylate kinase
MSKERGYSIVIDGLDGIGKGEVERAIIAYEQRLGRACFDTISFSRANRKGLPELKDFWNPPETYYDTIITAEPTYAGIGHSIRNEMIFNNDRNYPVESTIQGYSIDRLIQMKRLVIPALDSGLREIRSRCFLSTDIYQVQQAIDQGKDPVKIKKMIRNHPGTKIELEYAPDLLIIPTIDDAQKVIERLKERGLTRKEDNSIFDNLQFQEKLKPRYEEPSVRELFEKYGTRVEYLDAGISPESTRKQAIKIYKDFLENY